MDRTGRDDGPVAGAVARMLAVEVVSTVPVHGGDVASSSRLELAEGRTVFAKTHPGGPPAWATTEASGLRWLRDGVEAAGVATDLCVPRVLGVDDDTSIGGLLVLEWVPVGGRRTGTEARLGRALAALHATGATCFGREDGRPTGSRRLPNDPCDTWAGFYAERRLRPLVRIARDARALPERGLAALDRLAHPDRLARLGGMTEPPARLHGDLWAGNRLVGADGRHWLVDPAAHGGHREFDLAMMRLFGGFGAACFDAYQEAAPLADGWEDRVALLQIAPLVVHAVKFGGGYVGAAMAAIERYA